MLNSYNNFWAFAIIIGSSSPILQKYLNRSLNWLEKKFRSDGQAHVMTRS
jgi:hypothetical protein